MRPRFLRWVVYPFLAASTVAAAMAVSHQSAWDSRCAAIVADRQADAPYYVDWEWIPPRSVCVFVDERGRVLSRRQP